MVRTVFVQYLQMVILKKQDYEHQTKCQTSHFQLLVVCGKVPPICVHLCMKGRVGNYRRG